MNYYLQAENFKSRYVKVVQYIITLMISFISLNSYQCIHLEKNVQKLIKKKKYQQLNTHAIAFFAYVEVSQYIHIQFRFPRTILYLQLGVLALLQENLQADTPFNTCHPRQKHGHSNLKIAFHRPPRCRLYDQSQVLQHLL
jgi:hypothetical protein